MSESLLDLLMPPCAGSGHPIYGVVVGIVTNNHDKEGLGRVRVRFPWLSDSDESAWARIAVPMAGKGRGAYFLPEVDDEVLVAFERGDVRFPCVLGGLWNGTDTPPETNGDGKNNRRLITSRSGHTICFDDTSGSETISISDQNAKNSIVIDVANNTVTISADSDIAIKSKSGKITISGTGIELVSQAEVKIEASADMNVKAGGQMTIKGTTVNLN